MKLITSLVIVDSVWL